MKISEQLTKRLKAEHGFDVVTIERIQRGKWSKGAGTWAWTAKTATGSEVGSEDTMGECVKAKKLHIRRPPWEHGLVYHIDAEPSNSKLSEPRKV